MPRAKNSPATKRRRKKILSMAKGYRAGRRRLFKTAKETVQRALVYAYRDRRVRKRFFRRLWIARIGAATKEAGLSYSVFMNRLKQTKVDLNRKILADMAVNDPAAFSELIEIAKKTG